MSANGNDLARLLVLQFQCFYAYVKNGRALCFLFCFCCLPVAFLKLIHLLSCVSSLLMWSQVFSSVDSP